MKQNILELFLSKVLIFPLWVKQIIFLRLYQNLSEFLSEDFIRTEEKNIFHLYTPLLSFAGKEEIIDRRGGYDTNVYNFLTSVNEGATILEISMNNFWTLEETAKYFVLCLEQDYIKTPESIYIIAMANFMSGKFRIGEYFKAIGKIDVDQLEQTILKQKEYAQAGTPKKMAEIMISMGFITKKETVSLLKIKEEAKTRFILDSSIVPNVGVNANLKEEDYKNQIAKLMDQNNKLKDQLRKLLVFVKKNG